MPCFHIQCAILSRPGGKSIYYVLLYIKAMHKKQPGGPMIQDKSVRQIDITRIDSNRKHHIKDNIIDEDILEIFINNIKAFEMVASMTRTRELAAGFLFTQGIVREIKDIIQIKVFKPEKQVHVQLAGPAELRFNKLRGNIQTKASSGGTLLQNPENAADSLKKTSLCISSGQVLNLIKQHRDHSDLFRQTGAVHSAAICTADTIISYYEDIGRHNALDKMAGDILMKNIYTGDKIATLSCRMSLEIIGKILRTGIPVVISNAAPTLPAVKLAAKAGLTMIGFARGERFNIYTGEEKITISSP